MVRTMQDLVSQLLECDTAIAFFTMLYYWYFHLPIRIIHYTLQVQIYDFTGQVFARRLLQFWEFRDQLQPEQADESRPAHKQLMMEHPPMQSLVHHPSLYGIQPKSSRSVCSSSSSSTASFIMLYPIPNLQASYLQRRLINEEERFHV